MKKKALTAMVALVVVLLLLTGVSHAITGKQKPLVGLKGVGVLVEDMNPRAESLGLTAAQIQTDVELRLRKAGVRVLTEEERVEIPEMPYLYVNVNALLMRDPPNFFVYAVSVQLDEMVTLANGSQTTGTIWNTGEVGGGGIKRTSEIRKSVGDQVDRFINDYLAANPKK